MTPREELEALRRLAELEEKAKGSAASTIQNDAITQAAQNPAADMSGPGRFAAGMGMGMTNLARGVGQRLREGIEAVTPAKLSEQVTGKRDTLADTFGLPTQQDIDASKRRDSSLSGTLGGAAGDITGKVALALPTMLIPGANTVTGAALTGAAMGAAEPTASTDKGIGGMPSVASNMLTGGIGGAVGQMAGQALGRALRPVASTLSPEMQALADAARARGIPLDAADLTGSRPLTTIRDVLSQMPLTADRQAAIQATKQGAFNRAVGGTFGAADDALTPQVLSSARDRIGQSFTDLSARNAAQIDNGVLGRFGQIVDEANRYGTPDVARVVGNFADDIIGKVDANGQLPGQAYRALDSQMGRVMRSTTNGDIRHAVGQLRDSLRTAMDDSISAADQGAWRQARREYANLMTVAPLAAKNEAGDVSGRTLLAAALRGNKSGMFTGGGDLGELGRIGRAFVAEQTPNSGTAQRLFYQRFLENPINALWQQGVGGASLPAQALLNSRAGQAYLANGLVPISENARMLANTLTRGTGAALSPSARE